MKKLACIALLLLICQPVYAAQQTILAGSGILWGDEKDKINANFTELYNQAFDAMISDIVALTDPGADRIPFWDDSAGEIVWLTAGSGLTITGTTITASGGGGYVDTSGTPATNDFARFVDADTIEGRSYSEVRSDLGLVIGTNVEAYDAAITKSDEAETISSVWTFGSDIVFSEQTDHGSTPGPGYGYLWVDDSAPSSLKFTDDEGTDYQLSSNRLKGIVDVSVSSNGSHLTIDTDGTIGVFNWPSLVDSTEVEQLNGIGAQPISSQLSEKLAIADIDDTPVNGVTTAPVSSNWAYDHAAASDPHPGYVLESAAGTAHTRNAEDTLTNGSNLPDGAAIITYGNANWNDSGTDDQTATEVNTSTTNFDNNLSGADTTVQAALDTIDNLSLGGSTSYNDIGDPSANGSISFGSYTGTYYSGTDAWGGIIITSTDADNAADTTLLTLNHYDDFDTNSIFLQAVNNSDADADNIFKITGLGVYVGEGTPDQTLTGDDVFISGFLEVDGSLYLDGGIVAASSTDPYIQLDVTDADDTDWTIGVNADAGASSDDDLEFRTSTTPGSGVIAKLEPDTGDFKLNGSVYIQEQADAGTDVAGYGQLWVNTATPNELWWTNDAGTDVQLGTSSSSTQSKDIVVEDPEDADSWIIFKAPEAITISDIHCIADGGTSVVIDVQECSSSGASCATVDATITCDTDGAEDDGSLSNGAIDSGDWVKLDIGTVTGTVDALSVSIYY